MPAIINQLFLYFYFFDSEEEFSAHQCPLSVPDPNILSIETYKCELCPSKIALPTKTGLKKHYALAHYQKFFADQHRNLHFPMPCGKKTCGINIVDSRQLALHYAIDHKKLSKALKLEGKHDMTQVIATLCAGEEGSLTTSDSSLKSPIPPARNSVDEAESPNTSSSSPAKRIPGLGSKNLKCPKCLKISTEGLNVHLAAHYQ